MSSQQAIITLDESDPKKHTLVVTPGNLYNLEPGSEFVLTNNTIHTVYFWGVELVDDVAFLDVCPHKALPLAAGQSTAVQSLGALEGLAYGISQSTGAEPEAVLGASKKSELEPPAADSDDSDDSDDGDDSDDSDDEPPIDRGTGE